MYPADIDPGTGERGVCGRSLRGRVIIRGRKEHIEPVVDEDQFLGSVCVFIDDHEVHSPDGKIGVVGATAGCIHEDMVAGRIKLVGHIVDYQTIRFGPRAPVLALHIMSVVRYGDLVECQGDVVGSIPVPFVPGVGHIQVCVFHGRTDRNGQVFCGPGYRGSTGIDPGILAVPKGCQDIAVEIIDFLCGNVRAVTPPPACISVVDDCRLICVLVVGLIALGDHILRIDRDCDRDRIAGMPIHRVRDTHDGAVP